MALQVIQKHLKNMHDYKLQNMQKVAGFVKCEVIDYFFILSWKTCSHISYRND